MDIIKFLITPVSCAVIGYFTNWIAIKMLFRPHTEKKLFGFKLPFTPGLIPKERFKLAEAVGSTIGTHLFTEDVIVDSLSTGEVKESIQNILTKLYEGVANSEYTIDGLCDMLLKENKKPIIENAVNIISAKAFEAVTQEKTVEQITAYIINLVSDFAKKPIAQYKLSRFSETIETLYNKYAKDFANNEEFGNLLYSFLIDLESKITVQDKTISGYLPKDTDLFVKGLAENNMKSIFDVIKALINIEEVNLLIKKMLADIINENIGKLMSLFVNTDKITENIMTNFNEYLSADENIPTMLEKVNSLIDKLMEVELNKIISKIPDDMRLAAGTKAVEAVRYIIRDSDIIPKLAASFNNFIEINNEKSIYGFLEGIEPELLANLKSFVMSKIKELIEHNGLSFTNKTLTIALNKLMPLKINTLTSLISDEAFKSFEAYLTSNIGLIVQKIAPHIISAVNIPKVVEQRINSFDVGYAEEIIINIVNKELKLITMLGGVLGFIIGMLPAIISVIGM